MKTAIVHDWFDKIAGSEKVVKSIYELFPSKIYTLLKNEKNIKNSFFNNLDIETSFIQKLFFSKKHFRKYLPFFPLAIEQFDLSDYNVILSSSHSVAKSVLTTSEQLHICYCHSPMRYVWDMYFDYLKMNNLNNNIKGKITKVLIHYLRSFDVTSSNRVDHFIANSKYVAKRIKKVYGRESKVIYPPVDTNFFNPCFKKDNYYLTASRLVPYKKIDVIVEAFSKMPDKKLLVIGSGPDLNKIKSKATKNIEILGFQQDDILKKYLQEAKAFIFAAKEDFGILPVEAQASATPVIAFSKGGAKETIIENKTGLFFDEQTPSSIIDAVNDFEKKDFDLLEVVKNASRFSEDRFKKEYKDFITKCYNNF